MVTVSSTRADILREIKFILRRRAIIKKSDSWFARPSCIPKVISVKSFPNKWHAFFRNKT